MLIRNLLKERAINILIHRHWPGAHAPNLVDAQVVRNAEQPLRDPPALAGEAAAAPPDAPEYLLHNLFGQFRAFHDPHGQAVHSGSIPIVQQFERLRVTG
jgi:hypothetical protein